MNENTTTRRRPRDELVAALLNDDPLNAPQGFVNVGLAAWKDTDGRQRYGRRYVSIDALAQGDVQHG